MRSVAASSTHQHCCKILMQSLLTLSHCGFAVVRSLNVRDYYGNLSYSQIYYSHTCKIVCEYLKNY